MAEKNSKPIENKQIGFGPEIRKHNFSGGPGALPDAVLEEAQQAIAELPGTGLSILGLSHRSRQFELIVEEAEVNFRHLLALPSNYRVLFMQGGGSQQFSMVPMHLLRGQERQADYIVSGYWSQKSLLEARKEGKIRILWDGTECGFSKVPRTAELDPNPDAAYLHYVSNETVEGVQFHDIPGCDEVPRICDMSSDFLSRPHSVQAYDLIYAHAQKNLGPAGVTVVVVRDWILEKDLSELPSVLQYKLYAEHNSIFNTPPVFAIYVTLLVSRWLRYNIGGLEKMAAINHRKAERIYGLLDTYPDFFEPHAQIDSRSLMNVSFRLRERKLEATLVEKANSAGFCGITGHRSIGGLRISLYNAVSEHSVNAICEFLEDFVERQQRFSEWAKRSPVGSEVSPASLLP